MFKNRLSLFIALMLIFTLFVGTNVAVADKIKADDEEILVFEASEITDQNILLERAKNGVNESTSNPASVIALTKDNKSVDIDKIKVHATIQKLSTNKNLKTGKLTSQYKLVSFADIPLSVLSTDIDSSSGWDQTGGIRATCTIYFDEMTCGQVKYIKMNSINGTWDRFDSSITWSNSKIGVFTQSTVAYSNCNVYWQGVMTGYDEIKPSNGIPTSGTNYSMTPFLNSQTDLYGKYMSNRTGVDNNQGNMKIDLSRSGSSWNFTFSNSVRY